MFAADWPSEVKKINGYFCVLVMSSTAEHNKPQTFVHASLAVKRKCLAVLSFSEELIQEATNKIDDTNFYQQKNAWNPKS